MIQIVLRISAHPARSKDLIQALRSLALPAQAEDGYLGFELCRMVRDDRDFLYVEKWRSIEDVERQIRSSRFSKLLEVMETSVDPPSLEFNTVSDTRGLDLVEAVRHCTNGHGTGQPN